MIEIKNLSKSFDDIKAVDDVSFVVTDKTVFGLIGTNGAGKSTTLRMIAGVYKQDSGEVFVDGALVYANADTKKNIFFVADEPFFIPNSNAQDMEEFYSGIYPNFDKTMYYSYLEKFQLDKKRKVNTFSKGMKKQLAIIIALSAKTKYVLCDETFDGLDPVMRQAVKSMMAKEIEDRGLTIVIASHNLRELEDICDHVGLLHKGGVLLSKDLEDMKLNIQKIQCVFTDEVDVEEFKKKLDLLNENKRGSLYTFTVRGAREKVQKEFDNVSTLFCEILPLSLEEIFISETEVAGYDIKNIILG